MLTSNFLYLASVTPMAMFSKSMNSAIFRSMLLLILFDGDAALISSSLSSKSDLRDMRGQGSVTDSPASPFFIRPRTSKFPPSTTLAPASEALPHSRPALHPPPAPPRHHLRRRVRLGLRAQSRPLP